MSRATPEHGIALLGDSEDISGDATVEQVAQLKQEWGFPSGKLIRLDSIERGGSQTVYGDAFCINGQIFSNMWRTTLGLLMKVADLEQLAQKAVQKLELKEKEIASGLHN